jgi:hypothetical protein
MHVAQGAHPRNRSDEQLVLQKRPVALWALLTIMTFLSIGGFIGGISFVSDPTGAGLGAHLSWLDKTPVHDFLLPGMFLVGVYGVLTLLLMAGLVWRPSPGFLRRVDGWSGFHWSWSATIVVGLVLVVWIVYELTIFPDRMVLQPTLIVVGALMVAIPSLPSMRSHYRTLGTR